jgi:hypothetical protein
LLGFDPDGAPTDILSTLAGLIARMDSSVVDEIAAGIARHGRIDTNGLRDLPRALEAHAIRGRFARRIRAAPPPGGMKPWEQGRSAARDLRRQLRLEGAVTDEQLSEMAGIDVVAAETRRTDRMPVGLAHLDEVNRGVAFLFRRSGRQDRRFEVVRYIGDHVLSAGHSRWMAATDSATVRQKAQRAFAAEFLCPIAALVDYLDGDRSQEAIEEAADHYGVTPWMISSHLTNNGHGISDHLQ